MKHILGYATKSENINVDEGVEFVMSDASVDRTEERILPTAWEIANFMRNPIALYQHIRYIPIGTWKDVRIEAGKLIGRLMPAAKGTSAEIDTIRELLRQNILRAVSVGFIPLEVDSQQNSKIYTYTKVELLECSLVSIPANQNALALAKQYGADPRELFTFSPVRGQVLNEAHQRALDRAAAAVTKADKAITP
jgi:HK97 family phage prohead protease